jgi:hypothetical protein
VFGNGLGYTVSSFESTSGELVSHGLQTHRPTLNRKERENMKTMNHIMDPEDLQAMTARVMAQAAR